MFWCPSDHIWIEPCPKTKHQSGSFSLSNYFFVFVNDSVRSAHRGIGMACLIYEYIQVISYRLYISIRFDELSKEESELVEELAIL